MVKRIILLFFSLGVLISFFPIPAQAAGIAMSGTFYQQYFKMLPGENLNTPDVYVIVFNKESEAITVKLVPNVPAGVTMVLPETEFSILPDEDRKVEVGLEISTEAVPGEYIVSLTAEIKRKGTGIVVTGGNEQQAKLSILGEAGNIHVIVQGPDKTLFPAQVRLYRQTDGQLAPVEYSETGEIDTRLVPGDYFVQAFFRDIEVAKAEFELLANERKEIVLSAQTVFVQGFSVSPVYSSEKKDNIVLANLSYTIQSIYKELKNVKAVLYISFDGALTEEIEIISMPSLATGNTGGNYKYAPALGWEEGKYSFLMKVYSEDVLYAQSQEKTLDVTKPLTQIMWPIVLGIGLAAAIGIVVFFRKRMIRR